MYQSAHSGTSFPLHVDLRHQPTEFYVFSNIWPADSGPLLCLPLDFCFQLFVSRHQRLFLLVVHALMFQCFLEAVFLFCSFTAHLIFWVVFIYNLDICLGWHWFVWCILLIIFVSCSFLFSSGLVWGLWPPLIVLFLFQLWCQLVRWSCGGVVLFCAPWFQSLWLSHYVSGALKGFVFVLFAVFGGCPLPMALLPVTSAPVVLCLAVFLFLFMGGLKKSILNLEFNNFYPSGILSQMS